MKQINLKQFFSLEEKEKIVYVFTLGSIKPKAIFKIEISKMTYNEVKQSYRKILEAKNECDIKELFIYLFKISEKQFYKIKIQDYFACKKYIEKFFIDLAEKESKLLSSINEDSALWEMAGGGSLNTYSDVLSLSQLAKIYGGYPFDYGEKYYLQIIYLLKMNIAVGKVEMEFQRLKSKQK